MDFEQVTIVGRLGANPALKYTQAGRPICNFNVAVGQGKSQDGQERPAKWFRVAVWGEQGELCHQYLSKGQEVLCVGRIEARAYLDKSGQPAVSLELAAQVVKFGQGGEREYVTNGAYHDFAPPPEDAGDIPF